MSVTEKLDSVFVPMGAGLLIVLVPLAIASIVFAVWNRGAK